MAGGAKTGGGRGCARMITEINVTPLVDIMLVLLIIFMVTAVYIVRDSLDVKLPEAATGERQKPSMLAVTIDQKGKLLLNGQAAKEADIRRFIRQARRKGEKPEAIVAADKRVPHGSVVRIIDVVRAEGVTKFAISVLRPET